MSPVFPEMLRGEALDGLLQQLRLLQKTFGSCNLVLLYFEITPLNLFVLILCAPHHEFEIEKKLLKKFLVSERWGQLNVQDNRKSELQALGRAGSSCLFFKWLHSSSLYVMARTLAYVLSHKHWTEWMRPSVLLYFHKKPQGSSD